MKSTVIIHFGVLLLCASLELVHGARYSWKFDAAHSFELFLSCITFQRECLPSKVHPTTSAHFHPHQILYNCSAGSTDHSNPWPEFTFNWRASFGTLVGFIGATLANSAGVGGGGLFVPMFRLLFGFDTKTSAALSKTMIMGGAIASAFYNLHKKHPKFNRPLIDYDLALLIQPMLLFGISLGVMSNVIFPDWFLTVLLVVILLGMASKSIGKGICVWQEESRAKQEQESPLQHEDLQKTSPDGIAQQEALESEDDSIQNGQCGMYISDHYASCIEYLPPLEDHVSQDSIWKLIMWKHVAALLLVWILYLIIQLAKVKTRTCSTLYWVLNVSQLPVSLVATTFGIWRVHHKHQVSLLEEKILGLCINEPKFEWKLQQLVLYPFLAVLAGFVGGFLGIGGGMVLAPVFLELGVIPQVSAATTTFIVVFSSSMSVVEFYLLGRLPVIFGLYFSSICAFSAIFGLYITQYFVSKYKRTSFIIFILALIIGASAVILGIFGGMEDLDKFMAGDYMGFCSFCYQ